MNLWPVIHRELRVEARRPFNYWLRVLGVAVALGIFVVMMLDQQGSASQLGAKLFGNLNTALFIAIWVLVPLLTADCISRERREGTLGLLLLTRLTSRGVVVGKCLIHASRAATMLLAALPVLALSFLLGGVTWREGVTALLFDSSSVCLALAAGLIASSCCFQWNRAMVLSEVLAAIFLCGFGCLLWIGLAHQVLAPFVAPVAAVFNLDAISWRDVLVQALIRLTGAGGGWGEGLNSLPPTAIPAWLLTAVELLLIAVLVSYAAILWVAHRLAQSRQEQPLSARELRWLRFFCGPRFWKSLFRRKMMRVLERNPIGWLEQRSTAARMIKWGWLLAVTVVESLVVADSGWSNLASSQLWLLVIMGISLAFSAAASFRRERRSGAMELILVTPLSVGQIILGRLRGLWGQFLPALALMFGVWVLLSLQIGILDFWSNALYYDTGSELDRWPALGMFLLASFVAIPLVGLYFSLGQRHFLAAWLLTGGLCLALPWLFLTETAWYGIFVGLNLGLNLGPQPWDPGEVLARASALQIVFASLAAWLLYRNLRRRKFAFGS